MQIVTPYKLFLITVVSGKPATSICRVRVTETEQKFDPEDGGRRWCYQPTRLHGVMTHNSLKMPDVM